jgi:hypothetical protein
MTKINVKRILGDHFETLKDYRTGRYSIMDLAVFLGIPLAASALLIWYGYRLGDDLANILLTSLSIFSALLFNLLLLVYDVTIKEGGSETRSEMRRNLLKQTFANISFVILVAVSAVILILLVLILEPNALRLPHAMASFLIFYLVGVFVVHLLMILKRVHILLTEEFSSRGPLH